MAWIRPLVIPLATLTALLAAGCGRKQIAEPTQPGQALIVLLPDADTGTTGRALVSSKSGSADLVAERDSTLATANRRPGPVTTLSEADVRRLFGEALSALPQPPRHFTLYFRFESDELTDESRALVPEILRTVKAYSAPEVVVVGHTDRMGTSKDNIELGMKRAVFVRSLLVEAGLSASTIQIASHGEVDLEIHTPDETPEPRNRRVEVTVR